MEYLVVAIVFVAGILMGMHLYHNRTKHNTMGRLRIDHSEPDEPTRMFVELKGVTPDMIAEYDTVMFEVVNESFISHD